MAWRGRMVQWSLFLPPELKIEGSNPRKGERLQVFVLQCCRYSLDVPWCSDIH
jgi:hypothetical protein